MQKFIHFIPIRTMGFIILIWLSLGIINYVLIRAGLPLGTPEWFPMSVFRGPAIHLHGIPYLLAFLVVLVIAYRFSPRLNIYHIWLLGIFLIILGNLGQGDWDSAFYKPFYKSGVQYYHDAIRIDSWSGWLKSFNASQHTLLGHTRTHPPFAVLSHYLLLQVSEDNLFFLSLMFTLISSLSIILVWHIFKILDVYSEERNILAIIFSVIPAVNIYSAVCLDGVILTSTTLFLFGIVSIIKPETISFIGLLSMLLGLTITNLLTYGGIFLVMVAGIQALKEIIISKKFNIAISLTISVGLFIVITAILSSMYGYNHVQGFLTASALENPAGFRGLHMPLEYLATRVENICEIKLFLSIGFLAMLFHPNRLGFSWSDWRDISVGIMLSGLITLLAMFVCGAFSTGETARAALFIYPYIMLALKNSNVRILRDILILAGLQTFAMQLFGRYFW